MKQRIINQTIGRDCPEFYLFELLGHGVDTWIETLNVEIPEFHWGKFKSLQTDARSMKFGEGEGRAFEFGQRVFRMRPFGGGGAVYLIDGADTNIAIRPEGMKWNVSARFSSWGLWTRGLDALLADLDRDLEMEGIKRVVEAGTSSRCSRIDYAFDFLCPSFTAEARPELLRQFVLTGGSKAAIYTSGNGDDCRAETFRVGRLANIQIEVYDKGKEIREKSGKTWMRDVWKLDDTDPLEDIWRIEVRFGGEYFKNHRELRSSYAVRGAMPEMIAGALMQKRLTLPGRTRARRADMHPLWAAAHEASGNAQCAPMIDRRPTLARAELIDVLEKQMAGLVRARSVLKYGSFVDDATSELVQTAQALRAGCPGGFWKAAYVVERYSELIAEDLEQRIAKDKAHARKVDAVMAKSMFIDQGK